MAQPVRLIRALTTEVVIGGHAVVVNDGTLGTAGGLIQNPKTAADQGIDGGVAEPLFINLIGPAGLAAFPANGTVAVEPGQFFLVPPLCTVWANAASSGHKFVAYFKNPYNPPTPQPVPPGPGLSLGAPGAFPPPGPTGLTQVIPSYLYQEYSDDDDLQGFVDAQNQMQQNYVDTFNTLNLPIYSSDPVSGPLLDWVARGLYGMTRPFLTSGQPIRIGPINTYGFAIGSIAELPPTVEQQLPAINQLVVLTPYNAAITSDDFYRRVLTWHLFKGDGKYFNMRWLKRRVWRFIYGVNGVPVESLPNFYPPNLGPDGAAYPQIADTEQISITAGVNRSIDIRFVLGERKVIGGALLNRLGSNGIGVLATVLDPEATGEPWAPITPNNLLTSYEAFQPLPYMREFQQAVASGVLELPLPWNYTVTIG